MRRPGERQLLRRGQRRLTGAMLGGGPPGRDDLTLVPLGGGHWVGGHQAGMTVPWPCRA